MKRTVVDVETGPIWEVGMVKSQGWRGVELYLSKNAFEKWRVLFEYI